MHRAKRVRDLNALDRDGTLRIGATDTRGDDLVLRRVPDPDTESGRRRRPPTAEGIFDDASRG